MRVYLTDKFCFSVVNDATTTVHVKELNSLSQIAELLKNGFISCIDNLLNRYAIEYYLDVAIPASKTQIVKLEKGDRLYVFQLPSKIESSENTLSREELNKMVKDVKIFEVSIG